ncbi:uncharacterized protein LOC144643419 [Oculina patagonica]
MHIYLKDGHQRRWVTDVHLQEGFSPCIGNGLTRKSCADVSRLEPAIWFKVLVLESVSVDCGRRIVSWSTGSHCEDSDLSNQRTFYMEGECYDYDADIDELFLLAAKIICPAGQEENGFSQPSDEDYEQCLLRMLHCYILPKITLHQDDLDKVINAREKQVQNIQTLDRKVIEECKSIDACELRMEDLRTQFLPDLEKFINKGWCSKGFLDLLLEDVSKEEPRLRQQIDKAQDQVQHAKQMLAQKRCDTLNEQLSAARQQRDVEIGKLDALLMARELIISAIPQASSVRGRTAVGHYLLRQYLEERERLAGLKQNRNRLLEQKNCALSVREMLESATEELLEKGYTDANDANALGSRATDVLEGVWKPEWQKLGERIATLVNNEEHPIGNHFKKFCLRIHTLCQELIELGRCGSPDGFTPSCSPFGISVCPPSQCEAYGLEDFVVENHRHKLQLLQSEIFKQLDTATEFLSDFFNNKDVQFKNKIRLCYEQCFYDKEHSFLACVYELAHHEHVDSIERDVQRLRRLPIKLLNLQMKDEWWLELFEQNSHRTSISPGHLRPFTEAYINGTLLDQTDSGLSGSYDMIDDLDDFVGDEEAQHVDSFRSLCISAIRNRSKTVTAEEVQVAIDLPDAGRRPKAKPQPRVEAVLSSSAPAGEMALTMGEIIDLWETTKETNKRGAENGPRKAPLQRTLSKSQGELSKQDSKVSGETFEDHFGPALENMRDIFKVTSPLNKLKCLTSSLRKITNAVQELRMRSGKDTFAAAVNAEDLLPLLVLMMLQMDPWEVASMWPQLAFTEDLMAPFLSSGCHGWALVEFQMAQRILHQLCQEF